MKNDFILPLKRLFSVYEVNRERFSMTHCASSVQDLYEQCPATCNSGAPLHGELFRLMDNCLCVLLHKQNHNKSVQNHFLWCVGVK